MKTPEWDKELDKGLKEHEETENVHRAIFVSKSEPKSTDGKDGDIWIVYK